jgi:hypothetical protein
MPNEIFNALGQVPVSYTNVEGNDASSLFNYETQVKPVSANVITHNEDSSRMEVAFILSSPTPYQVFNYASRPELIEFGLRLVTKAGLERPGFSNLSPPIPCSAKGDPIDPVRLHTTFESDKAPIPKLVYYKVVYFYLGEN